MRKLVLSLTTLALFAAPALAGEYNTKIDIGQKAPDISSIEAITPNGETTSLNLGDIKDDVVVVVFLANHCPVVLAYEDRINEFVEEYKDKGVKLVAVATTGAQYEKTDNLAAIKERAIKDKKFNYVYGFDKSQDIGRSYGATNTPQFFVLDKDRKIVYTGAMDDSQNESRVKHQYLRDAVDALLAGKEIKVKETRAVGCSVIYNK